MGVWSLRYSDDGLPEWLTGESALPGWAKSAWGRKRAGALVGRSLHSAVDRRHAGGEAQDYPGLGPDSPIDRAS